MAKIKHAHNDKYQDGFAYIRVEKMGRDDGRQVYCFPTLDHGFKFEMYSDKYESERVISSRRVETAVEMVDYMKRCFEEGLWVECTPAGFCVKKEYDRDNDLCAWGDTLREAYHRFHHQYDEQ